jgi:hydrophobic/amphiphilic exporter-1 (mainly G- bacteria), HAE1 family
MAQRSGWVDMTDHSVFGITVRRPVAIFMIVIAIVVFGYVSYKRLALNLMPDISYPTITVRTEFEGAAPEEVENNVSRRVEQALAVVNNLSTISSISRSGMSDVILEFRWGTDINTAIQDIREKLDQVFLPKEAGKPVILRYDPTLDPILTFGLTSKKESLMYLRNFSEDNIKIRLDKIQGVAAVKIRGGLEEEFHVDINPSKLTGLNMDIDTVNNRLASENVNLAGGKLKEGATEYIVRTVNQFKNLDDIRNLIIGTTNGVEIRIKDIGKVSRSFKDREVITRINGRECVILEIYKEADANIVDVAKRVKFQMLTTKGKTVRTSLPKHMKVDLLSDQSVFIENALNEVKDNALVGALLAILVLFLFLKNIKSTLIVSVTIPLSIVTTFAFMKFFDVSLNIMSLGGIALGVGMLVDNAIVVLESIFRCQEEGDEIADAAVRGTSEVGTAVVASTLTTIAVFFPIVFVEGIAGQIFKDMALSVVFALIASLMFALFFIPMLASRRFTPGKSTGFKLGSSLLHFQSFSGFIGPLPRNWLLKPIAALFRVIRLLFYFPLEVMAKIFVLAYLFFLGIVWISRIIWTALDKFILNRVLTNFNNGFNWVQNDWYPKALKLVLGNKLLSVILILIAFAITFFSFRGLDAELIPVMHQGQFTVIVNFPVGTPIEKTDSLLMPYESKLSSIKTIRTYFTRIGVEKDSYAKADEGEFSARIGVILKPSDDILKTEQDTISKIREIFSNIPDAEMRVEYPTLFTFKAPVEVEVHGYNLQKLKKYSMLALEKMKEIPDLKDVELNIRTGNPETQIVFDRDKLARLNLNIVKVADLVRNQLLGYVPTKFIRGDKRIDIRVKLKNNTKKTLEDLKNIIVNPGQKPAVPLSAVAAFNIVEGPSEIRRVDQQRVGLISANITGLGLKALSKQIQKKLSNIPHPSDIEYVISGQNQEMEKSSKSLLYALLLSIFLVYIVMASQFESLLHPFVIMFSIPLALFGVGITLYTLHIPMSVIVFIGLMMLAGIVVNNAIVLIDYINLLRKRGMEIREAIILAGKVRLRPIIMTTLTTVLGLLPLAMGLGEGAEIRQPMAITVIAGLIFSTVLTLMVIPTLYELVEALKAKLTGEDGTGETQT